MPRRASAESESHAAARRNLDIPAPSHALQGRATISAVRDTSEPSNARYHELLRALPPERRLEAAMSLSRGVRALAEAGIRERHPDASAAEIRVRMTVRMYGRAAAERLFGSVPADAV
jgi:DNA-binding HxlR family transcriptional regulator